MPQTLKQIAPAVMRKRPSPAPAPTVHAPPLPRTRSFLFFVADFVFLVLVGVSATLTMHLVHQLEWPFIPMCVTGMITAMLVQMLMAFSAAPLLGSIESMVPSMIVAMVSPMAICLFHLFGCESTWMMGAVIGSAFAVGTFAFIRLYARSCRHGLACSTESPRS